MSFAPGIRLELRQQQSLVLTPQLQQAIRLLQMSNLELAGAIDHEVAENPFLQRSDREVAPAGLANGAAAPAAMNGAAPVPAAGAEPAPTHRPADCSLSLKRPAGRAFDDDRQPFEERLTRIKGLREHLGEQVLAMLQGGPERAIAHQLVESVDDDGYLREDDATLAARCGSDVATVRAVRAAIQRCEPTGVGARDLGECLALQLAEKDRLDPAMATLLANLPLLARADFAELMRRCGVDAEDLQEMIGEIKRLDPRPGLRFDDRRAADPDPRPLRPGTRARALAGRAQQRDPAAGAGRHRLPCRARPRTRSTAAPRNTWPSASSRRTGWPRRSTSARARSCAWPRRSSPASCRSSTMASSSCGPWSCATSPTPPGCTRARSAGRPRTSMWRPRTERSRSSTSSPPRSPTSSGEQSHSAEAIRQLIRRLIEREAADEVLSDDQIVAELKKRDVVLARRTVAKYRESLGIASSVDRRRAKALGR